MSQGQKTYKRKLTGVVVSNKCQNTLVVKVTRRFKHPKYLKYVEKSKKYHAHTTTPVEEGKIITIIESRPHSKLKKWEFFNLINA